MQYMIKVAGISTVLGIDWIRLNGDARERVAEQRAHMEALDARFSLALSGPQGQLVFGAADASTKRLTATTVSGAAWLAREIGAARDVVFVKELHQGLVWLCAIQGGLPLARGDRVIKREALNEVIDDLMIAHERNQFNFILDEREPGSLSGLLGNHLLLALTTLLKSVPPRDCYLKGRQWLPILLGALAVFAVVTAGIIGYQQFLQYQERQAALARHVPPPPKPEEVYANQFVSHFNSQPRYGALDFAHGVYDLIRRHQIIYNGWIFTKASCDAQARRCAVDFRRLPLAEGAPWVSDAPVQIDYGLDSASVRLPIALTPQPAPDPKRPFDLLQAYPEAAYAERILPTFRVWRDFGMVLQVEPPRTLASIPVSTSPIEVREGRWQISGPMSQFEMLESVPPGLTANKAEITIQNGIALFALSGTYWHAVRRPAMAQAAVAHGSQ